jgi:ABC-type Fe3+ transport system substrate-binding protein
VVGLNFLLPSLQSANLSQNATATASSVVTLNINYGTEKEAWFTEAISQFQKANPGILVNLKGQGSMASYAALSQISETSKTLGNDPIPALWSPAASIQVNLLNSQNQMNKELAASCKRLVLSPLVIMAWEDRAKVFEAAYKDKGGITFSNLFDAVDRKGKAQGKWENIGGDPAWGYIKLGHTDPSSSNSGMMLLLGLANNFYGRTQALTVPEITDSKFVYFMTEIEKAVTTPLGSSTGTFMDDVVTKGPSSYDFVLVYEALALEKYKAAIGRQAQPLRIVYPAYNLYSDHPLCLIDHPSITADQRTAAVKLQQFLLTPEIQKLAVKYGFRPADSNIPIFGAGSSFDDPDIKNAGVSANVGQEMQIPAGNVLLQLLNTWRREAKPG